MRLQSELSATIFCVLRETADAAGHKIRPKKVWFQPKISSNVYDGEVQMKKRLSHIISLCDSPFYQIGEKREESGNSKEVYEFSVQIRQLLARTFCAQ